MDLIESAGSGALSSAGQGGRVGARSTNLSLALVGLLLPALSACTSTTSTAAPAPPARVAALPTVRAAFGTSLPPWRRPINVQGGADAAGLRIGPKQSPARRFDCHLDVFIDGKRTPVAAGLGVDGDYVSELRTSDTTGTLEVESSGADKRYVLGQLFVEWDVRLGPAYLGGLTVDATHNLTAFVNGTEVSGDPARIELVPHREIALVYGTPPSKIPNTYGFPAGS